MARALGVTLELDDEQVARGALGHLAVLVNTLRKPACASVRYACTSPQVLPT